MNILFDITMVGQSYGKKPVAKSGLYRVVDNLARKLALSNECAVSFSALNRVDLTNPCLSYLKNASRLKHESFFYSKSPRFFLYNMIASILDFLPDKKNSSSRTYKRIHHVIKRSSQMTCENGTAFPEKWTSQMDIFHSPVYKIPESIQKNKKIRKALTVHDLTPIKLGGLWKNELIIGPILKTWSSENWAFCISESTRNDLCEYLDMNTSQTFVTPLAASPEYFYPCTDSKSINAVRRKYNIPEGNYILALNTLAPHKNLDHLIRCFTRLIRQEKLKDLHLVLAGPSGWYEEKIHEALAESGLAKKQIHIIGFADNEHLAALYSGAMFFTFLSLYEGFGLPPLEAMQCGSPVITSNTSSLPEVVGDAGIMLDPKDADGLCGEMLRLYNNKDLRQEMSQKSIKRAALFSWDKTVKKTIAGYRQIMDS